MRSVEIRTVEDDFDLRYLGTFMLRQPQFYPDYPEWVEGKCLPRIEQQLAEALIVIQDGIVVGNAVYQQLSIPTRVEIKNLRIDEDYRNRSIGLFLLKQVELAAISDFHRDTERLTLVTDVSTPNFSGVEFFIRNCFHITGIAPLYLPDQMEYIMEKTVGT